MSKEIEQKGENKSEELLFSSSCPPEDIVFDAERGEYICASTGEVLESRLVSQGPEWRAFTPEEKEKRSKGGLYV